MKCLTNSNQIKHLNARTIKKQRIQLNSNRDNIEMEFSNRTLLTQDHYSYIYPKRVKPFKKDIKNISNLSIQTQRTILKNRTSNDSRDITLYKEQKNNHPYKDKEKEKIQIHSAIITNNYFQCIFCEKYILKDLNTNRIKCSHKFCYQCGKLYYEGKIEEGYYKTFKCCVFDCKSTIDMDILYSILSKTHLEIFQEVPEVKDNSIYSINIDLQKYFDTNKIGIIKKYSLKHIIDVNTNQQFFQYKSGKQMACPLCYEFALYGKTDQHFVKCFNCFYKLCKHCLLEYSHSHMNFASESRCKVYFRRSKPESNDSNLCLRLLLVFAGFVLISSICFVYTKKTLSITNKFKRIVVFGLSLIVSIISMPLFLLSLPYYPLLTCISCEYICY